MIAAAVTRLRPPPYGREMIEARRNGQYVNPWVYAGKRAFELASRRGPGRLVLPEGDDPAGFDWRCVAGLDVVVRWPGASVQQVDELATLLIVAGANTVNVLSDIRDGAELRGHRRHVRAAA